ncbi:MAG TPA: hypothetical protein VKE22_21725 [Haliangiales bacterium]|nr:hypothetical protein [Haliangiales bacterium]
MGNNNRPTEVLTGLVLGNDLFEKAVAAVGLDPNILRHLIANALVALGSRPQDMTPDELGAVLPSLEDKLRLLVPDEKARKSIAKLRHFLLSWEG